MSSNKIQKSLLNDIFIEAKGTSQKYLPILKSSDKIIKVISFLNDTKNQIKDKRKAIF